MPHFIVAGTQQAIELDHIEDVDGIRYEDEYEDGELLVPCQADIQMLHPPQGMQHE